MWHQHNSGISLAPMNSGMSDNSVLLLWLRTCSQYSTLVMLPFQVPPLHVPRVLTTLLTNTRHPHTPLTTSRAKCRTFSSLSQIQNKRTNHGSVLFEFIMRGIVRTTAAPQQNLMASHFVGEKEKIVALNTGALSQVYNAWSSPRKCITPGVPRGGLPYEKLGDVRRGIFVFTPKRYNVTLRLSLAP